MQCSSCQHENAGGASFCEECGARLERRCPSCDAPCGPAAKFCSSCGTSLAPRAVSPRAEAVGGRKVVTILFSDLIGSVALQERLDPESASRVMERYHRLVRAQVEAEGGSLVQLIGDGVMCAFGVPQVAEDDALRAVRAAVAVQRAFREFADEESARVGRLGLRIAVNTGEVVPSVDLPAGIGDPLNVAARLQQEAKDGDVVIGEATERIVRDKVTLERLGVFSLKGRTETVAAYRVVSLERPAGAAATPFVGREHELERLTAVYDSTVADRRARLAVVLGSPGLGKSRLIDELGRRLGEDATVLAAHCDLTRGATFAPVAKALRAHLGIDDAAGTDATRAAVAAAAKGDDAESARIADGIAALLAGTPASPEETFFVVRRFLGGLAAERPLLLAIDDLQWAEPLLLDLLEHLVQWTTDVPLLVLVAARPELRESRSSLATTGGFVSAVVTLAGLEAGAATRLAANVIGAAELPAAVAGRVLATSEGNPLFVGELVRMLVSEGALKREGERWTASAELAKLEMPPTIQALLAARIERLRPEERMVLERAAVVGRQFSRAAVTHLLPREIADLDARLEALRRSELIEPDTGWLLGEPVLRFHHVLIRDAAYRRLLKNTRAELHERFADWLAGRAAGAVEHDETIGWHLEQAHQNLRELGPLDEPGRALGERAARHLAAAGRRALAREDLPLAGNLLGRALDRLDPADPARADLALDWCEALLAAADVGAAVRAVEELGRFTAGSDRLEAWHTCFSSQLAVFTDPKSLRATASAVAAAAERLAAAGDAAGEAKGHYVNAMALTRLGKIGACEAALDRALAAARRAGDRRRSNAVLAGAPVAALWGPSPVTRASGRCLDVVRVLRITEGAPGVEAVALRCQGVLEALRGRTDAARRMIATARHMVEELGITHQLLEADVFAGLIEFLEGDAAAAERSLRAAYEGLRDQGLGIDAARAAALLGRALLALDRGAEAETLSHESEALAGDDLKAASAWRAVRAEALARRGEHTAAVELARAAVEIAAATDALLDHADARLALAAALQAAGKGAEASAEEARAIELWEAKGATLLAERAKREGGRLSRPAPVTADAALASSQTRRAVRRNAAIEMRAALDAAVAARDLESFKDLFAEDLEYVDHLNHVTYGRVENGRNFEFLMSAQSLVVAHVPLASLGDSLALFRRRVTARGGMLGHSFDVGPYEHDTFLLAETDSRGKARRVESFSRDRLSDAVVRLYERFAEILPEGPERTRAAATAASIAAIVRRDLDRYPSVIAADARFSDRRVLGMGTARGAKTFTDGMRTFLELADDLVFRIDDILDLRPDALLTRETNSGRLREGGGAFERHFIQRLVCGEDGLLASLELLDADRIEEALTRFDQPRAPRRAAEGSKRRVRRNAAIEVTAALDAVVAAGDLTPLENLAAADLEYVDHMNHLTYGREEAGRNFEALKGAQTLVVTHEPLVSLGDSLALFNRRATARGTAERRFDVGPWEHDTFLVIETDPRGKCRRVDVFPPGRLGDAVVRLYGRFAELLPEGAERDRAAATARSVAALVGEPYDAERAPTTWAPNIEAVDHRRFGFGAAHGAKAFHALFRSLIDASEAFTIRVDDVLSARADALLMRRTNLGKDRASGGAYERAFCSLWLFGADGLVVRYEQFDVDREDQALARFDELTTELVEAAPKAKRRVRPNAATRGVARLDAAMAARDVDALKALSVGDVSVIDHPTGTTYDGAANLASRLMLLRAENLKFAHETLATIGDSLGLFRLAIEASGASGKTWDVGPYQREILILAEIRGALALRSEMFATDHLGAAVARMYAWHAELLAEGAERARAEAVARTVGVLVGPLDDWHAPAFARDVEGFDHRPVIGFGRWRSGDGMQHAIRAFREVATVTGYAIEDVLAVLPETLLLRARTSGEVGHGGGAYERELLQLYLFGADGLVERFEQFDPSQADEALARLDELTAGQTRSAAKPRRRVEPNAATRHADRIQAAITTRDAEALLEAQGEGAELISHPNGAVYGRQGLIDTVSMLWRSEHFSYGYEPLATLGESLALCRVRISVSGHGEQGPGESEFDLFDVVEADEHARSRRVELYAEDRLRDAVLRLYERYAELQPEGQERDRAAATARSVDAVLGPLDLERYAPVFAPTIEFHDRRHMGVGLVPGSDRVLGALQALVDSTNDATNRTDDVLALRSDGFLLRLTNCGTLRSSGGSYERPFLFLWIFGADGLAVRMEQFDVGREAEALARFDELTRERETAPARPVRRLRPNAATANLARLDAALAAGDTDAMPALLSEDHQSFEYGAGTVWNRGELLVRFHQMAKSPGAKHRHEPLATLGDSLGLFHLTTSASGETDSKLDIGPYDWEEFVLVETDPRGRNRRGESFAIDRLGDAMARLYERHAQLLPEGPERERVATMARSLLAWVGPFDLDPAARAHYLDRVRSSLAPDVEAVDHRILGTWSARGAQGFLDHSRSIADVAEDIVFRLDDVLALSERMVLVRCTHSGTDRAAGGRYERVYLILSVAAEEGRVGRVEYFEADREAEALARFDELTRERGTAPARPARRIRPNAATANVARIDTAMAEGDTEALPALFSDDVQAFEYVIGEIFQRPEVLLRFRDYAESRNADHRHEPLATLGDSLALFRLSITGSGETDARLDIGPYDWKELVLVEVDDLGLCRRGETFPADRLGDAIVRLYERYAELLPEGVERTRAAAIARLTVGTLGPAYDPERFVASCAPTVQAIDHRTLALWSATGTEELLKHFRSWYEVATDVVVRTEDVVALTSGALVVPTTNSGRDRVGGGAYERRFLMLFVFGADGRRTHFEWFDSDRHAEALARFDELAADASATQPEATPVERPRTRDRRVLPNVASLHTARIDAVVAAGDADALAGLFPVGAENLDHTTGTVFDRQGVLHSFRRVLAPLRCSRFAHEPLATLGDSLGLFRLSIEGTGSVDGEFDIGPFENEKIVLVDARARRAESFAAEHLGDAVVRLYERHAELLPEGPERVRAEAVSRSLAAAWGSLDIDRAAAALDPSIESIDHRTLGLWSSRGAEALLNHMRGYREVAEGITFRVDDVLGVRPDAFLGLWTTSGTDRAGGGPWENSYLLLVVFGADGRMIWMETFEPDGDAEALARFDELTAPQKPTRRVRPNAATIQAARLDAAVAAKDIDALPALFAENSEAVDHTTGTTWKRPGAVSSFRALMKAKDPKCTHEPLTTLGDSLAICRVSSSASGFSGGSFDVGPYEREQILLSEVDEKGRNLKSEAFAADRLGDAVVRLYERFAETRPEGAERDRAAATADAIAILIGPVEVDRFRSIHAPDIEFVDRRSLGFPPARGIDANMLRVRSLIDTSRDRALCVQDILGCQSNAILTRETLSGIDRASGGAFEREMLPLRIFAAEGSLTRLEWFDVGDEAEALARFDELTSPRPEAAKPERRLGRNAATAFAARADAAVAARDIESWASLLSADCKMVDHLVGLESDRDGAVRSLRILISNPNVSFRHEPLPTLGDSLALLRLSISATGGSGDFAEAGPFEIERVVLNETNADGLCRRSELFASDRLGEGVARLYEWYADSITDAQNRERATITARAVAFMLIEGRADDPKTLFAPNYQDVDHRLVGHGAVSTQEMTKVVLSLHQVADGLRYSVDDVLALSPSALLRKTTSFGVWREGRGSFERTFLALTTFDLDGRIARHEKFDIGHEAEALARFDELTREPARVAEKRTRRVQENDATAQAALVSSAFAARDFDALRSLHSDEFRVVVHTMGIELDRGEALDWLRRSLAEDADAALRQVPVTALGDSLAVAHVCLSGSSGVGDFGPWEHDELALIEANPRRQAERVEIFAHDRLGDAIVRLYERYAELLPEGPERACVAGTARSIAAMLGPLDVDRRAAALDSSFEHIDHQTLGTWSARGAEANLENLGSLQEVAENITFRIDDVLAVRPNALLAHWTASGTERAGGGTFEWPHLAVHRFGADGRFAWGETFDADRDADALARFDELTEKPARPAEVRTRRVRANDATAYAAHVEGAMAARDVDTLSSLLSDEWRVVDHTVGASWDREGTLFSWRALLRARDAKWRFEPLATLDVSLGLFRHLASGSGATDTKLDIGPFDLERIAVVDVDARGCGRHGELFASDRLDRAIVRLYERYSELLPEGPERKRAAAVAHAVADFFGPLDIDRFAAVLDPSMESVDHRILGTWSARSADEFVRNLRAYTQVAEGITFRIDDVVALRPDALLTRATAFGTERTGGGSFERPYLSLLRFGADGRITRGETYDVDREDAALARFDELTAERPAPRIENAATRAMDRFDAAWQAHDWQRVTSLLAPGYRESDRRRMARLEIERERSLESLRRTFDIPVSKFAYELLATRGDRLALFRTLWRGAGRTLGPSEVEFLELEEVNERGQFVLGVDWDRDDLNAAYAELDARFDAGEAAPHHLAGSTFARAIAARDWGAAAAMLAPDFAAIDHRRLGSWGEVRGPRAYVDMIKSLADLAPDFRLRVDHIVVSRGGALIIVDISGTWEGGAFEFPVSVMTAELDALGRFCRFDFYDYDRLEEARARFAEIRFDPLRIPANAATVALDRHFRALEARDWAALEAGCASTVDFDDRRRLVRLKGDRQMLIASRRLVGTSGTRVERTAVAVAGDRLALEPTRWTGGPPDFEMETLDLTEVDADGRIVAVVSFDPEDRRSASAELLDRFARGEGARPAAVLELGRAVFARDLDRIRATLPDDFVWNDHRRTGAGRLDRDGYVGWIKVLFEQSPDAFIEVLYEVAASEHGSLVITHGLGTLVDGGAFDFVNASLWRFRAGELAGAEVFEIEDLDVARARLDALAAERRS